jgi:hypothetical protein
VHYTPFIFGKAFLKFSNSKFLNVHTLNFQIFRIPHFGIVNVYSMCLIGYYHSYFYHQLISIIWVLWKSFIKMSFSNAIIFHFHKFSIKPKLKIGSNGFLIWFSWPSCVLKRNNVSWLPWLQMDQKKNL